MTTPEYPVAATMYCLGCDYCLDHLTEQRCPECGRTFDPSDFTSFKSGQTKLRRKLTGRICFACAAAGMILLAIELSNPPYISGILLYALALEAVAVIAGLVGLAQKSQSKRHIGFGFILVAVFVGTIIFVVAFLLYVLRSMPRAGWFL